MQDEINAEIRRQADVVPLIKARSVGTEKARVVESENVQGSNVSTPEQVRSENSFTNAGAIAPPYDPESMCSLLENSNSLRQNVDAYVTNIDGFGHRLEPVINFLADDAVEQLRNAMFAEQLHAASEEGEEEETVKVPSDEEVEKRMKELEDLMRREKMRLDSFFNFCCGDSSFIHLRRRTRQDLEVMGNGYWEVLRNAGEQIAQFVYVPGFTVRMLPYKPTDIVDVEIRVQIAPFVFTTETRRMQFRRFVQVHEGRVVYFKEFGDPRVMSAQTGNVFKSVEEMEKAESTDGGGAAVPTKPRAATEILHFLVASPRSSYGVPRWIGALLSVLGSRQSEEINFLYFENKAVPPLAIIVSGGRMTEEAVDRISDHIENEVKGKRNFHKILVIEAESEPGAGNSGNVKIEIKPLTDAQMQDSLFQKYDAQNMDKVGMAFRLPRMLRGDIRDFNRSTAEAALEFAEMQVFQPEREDFDWAMNRKILSSLGARFWKFESNGPITREPGKLADIVGQLLRAGAITPRDAREESAKVLNRDLSKLEDAFWMDQPIAVTAAGYIPADAAGAFVDADSATQFGPGRIDPNVGEDPDTAAKLIVDELKSLSTDDLNDAGALSPDQRSRFRRLPPAFQKSVIQQAADLVVLRNEIRAAEKQQAEDRFLAAKDAQADGE